MVPLLTSQDRWPFGSGPPVLRPALIRSRRPYREKYERCLLRDARADTWTDRLPAGDYAYDAELTHRSDVDTLIAHLEQAATVLR